MTPKRKRSLCSRVSLFFGALLFVAGTVAAVCSWLATMEHIDTFFDTQQMLFAKRLASAQYASLTSHLPETDDALAVRGRGDEGEQEDDALAFAVFSPEGKLLLSDGEEGKKFVFNPKANGFVNTRVKGDRWRIVWLTSQDGRVVVAVGQELEYRGEMAFEMLAGQMLPWLVLMPVLVLGLIIMLSRELSPLRRIAADLSARAPNDATPIEVGVQSEVWPLVQALNSLFARIDAMLRRERAFIANAAHELRTPLAGLSVQAQVAHSAKKPEARAHALVQLRKGINRTGRLVDQLLMLFRLESFDGAHARAQGAAASPAPRERLEWDGLVRCALEEAQGQIEGKGIRLAVSGASSAVVQGWKELLDVLLRNVIGNAVKYTPEGGAMEVVLEPRRLVVRNGCRDIAEADARRLGERFFRPPGQNEPGSGLGLSIAKRIAELHGLSMSISVRPGSFAVTIGLPGI